MRRTAVVAVLLVLTFAATALAGRPRLEQKRLRPADVALAKRTALRASDLAAGWTRTAASPEGPALPACPGVDLDFSAFTITGLAKSRFQRPGEAVESHVEVYASRRDAAADFRKASTTGAVKCLLTGLRRELARQSPGSRITSARLSRPRLGEQAMLYRVAMSVSTAAGTVPVFVDFLAFQRGRSDVLLAFTRAGDRPRGQLALGRRVAARMR
jgi:hypothetical protein